VGEWGWGGGRGGGRGGADLCDLPGNVCALLQRCFQKSEARRPNAGALMHRSLDVLLAAARACGPRHEVVSLSVYVSASAHVCV